MTTQSLATDFAPLHGTWIVIVAMNEIALGTLFWSYSAAFLKSK